MAITLRNTKGSALTHSELDGNFTDLDGRVLDSDGIRTLVDSNYVQLRMSAHYSGFDSDFGTKSTTNLTEGSNLYYTTARHDSDFGVKLDSSTTDNLSEGTTNLYYTSARFDSDLGAKTTTNLTEGTNLYYTTTRFDSDLGTKTTTDLTEGTNLYYTTARHDSDFTSSLNAATLAYATDSATLWNGTAPTTVDSALDRLALVVRSLNGGTGA